MKCKGCGKELIGKEKLFCKNCWSKGKDAGKVILAVAGGLVLTALTIVINKGKITDLLEGETKDN